MKSSICSRVQEPSGMRHLTTASTFKKPNSLSCELLFGKFQKKIFKIYENENLLDAYNYYFYPGEIFGYSYESMGRKLKKVHHTFVLQSCEPGEVGNIIPGINPGAKILVKTLGVAGSVRLKNALNLLKKNGINLSIIPVCKYERLNRLLEFKIRTDYLIGEMIFDQTMA